MKINVVNVIEEGKLGGPQVRICRVASQLKKNINTIVLMPKQNSIEFKNLCDLNSVEYIDVFLTRITKQFSVLFGYVFLFPFEIINLTYVLKKTKCDIVHVSGGSWQYKGLIAGKLAGKKVVWHLNDSSMPKIILLIFSIFSSYSDAFILSSALTKLEKEKLIIIIIIFKKNFLISETYNLSSNK